MTTTTDMDQATYDRIARDLQSGLFFDNHQASAASVPHSADWVVLNRKDWAHAVAALGRMAGGSDELAQLASHITPHVPLYQTRHELTAAIYRYAAEAVRAGYTDVIGRAGPEGPRHRGAVPYSLPTLITLAYWLAEATAPAAFHVPGVGWALSGLAKREQVYVQPMPSLA